MASIVKDGKVWRVQLYVHGMRESATFDLKSDAAAWAKRREAELREISVTSGPVSPDKRRFLRLSELYSESKIISTSFSAKPVAAVYFLIRDEKIVYVGQSTNVHARIAEHQKSKQFDRINFIECPEDHLYQLEKMYIQRFNPEMNIACRCDRIPTELL